MTFSLHDNDPSIIRGTCKKKRPVWKSYNDRVTKRGPKRSVFLARSPFHRSFLKRTLKENE